MVNDEECIEEMNDQLFSIQSDILSLIDVFNMCELNE